MASDVHKRLCAVLGLNQSRLAKRLALICYFGTLAVAWTLADQSAPGQLVAFVEQLVDLATRRLATMLADRPTHH
jgi:hypothetical protein